MSEMTWPRPLKDAHGPMRADKLEGAAIGMGDWGIESRALAAEGWVPPDMMTGLTLFVLGSQPKGKSKQAMPGAGGGVAAVVPLFILDWTSRFGGLFTLFGPNAF